VEFEAVSQNEVHGTQWLSEVNEDYPYIMSFEEKEGSNALPDKFSENLNRSSKFTKIFEMPIYISKRDSERVIPSDMPAESEPFYLTATTFSKVLYPDEKGYDSIRDLKNRVKQ
jgi:hypothetical protein